MLWATSRKGVSPSLIRGRAISATFNSTTGSNCPAYQVAVVERRYASSSGRVPAGTGTRPRSLEWWLVGSGRRGARCVINPTDSKARFAALSKLSTGHRTLTSDDVRRRMQGWCKQCKVQNMPLIWRMSYHATNSSHVTDQLLLSLIHISEPTRPY